VQDDHLQHQQQHRLQQQKLLLLQQQAALPAHLSAQRRCLLSMLQPTLLVVLQLHCPLLLRLVPHKSVGPPCLTAEAAS
jgi:hypothetical protein